MGQEEVEAQLRDQLAVGDVDAVIATALTAWGGEILGFLAARTGSVDHADEIFSVFCEDLVRYVHTYRGEAGFRSWCYAVARSAANRYYRRAANQAHRHVALSQAPGVQALAHKVRTATLPYLRTEVKDSFRALRDELEPEDRDMLILRVDRQMSWREVAAALLDVEEAAPDVVQRKSAQLRKRFERVKDELRDLALARGLIEQAP